MKLINDKIWLGLTALLFIPGGSACFGLFIFVHKHGFGIKNEWGFAASILMIILGAAAMMRLIYIHVSKTRYHG